MPPGPSDNSPWPAQTASPTISRERSKRSPAPSPSPTSYLVHRDISDAAAVEQAKTNCEIYANNDNVTCYPTANDQVYQHQYAAVVWNSRRPQIDQFNLVDIYLFNADTQQQIHSTLSYPNPIGVAGQYNVLVDDSWFGTQGSSWQPGANKTYPFYWIITNQNGLTGDQTTNPTFFAVQTTYLDSVVSSMSVSSLSTLSTHSTLSAASTASAASVASIASVSSVSVLSSPTQSGNIQQANASTPFPHWAIAVIVVLGFLAIVAGGVLIWLIMRRLRQRERLANRGSMGSSSPMMANAQNSNSPQLPLLASAAIGGGARTSSEHHRASSIVSPDGVSEISRAHSAGDQGPFSGADAAIMADAFRKALRKPDFAGATAEDPEERKDDTLINRELAEEGRDIRSVGSSRGVRVETLSDAGDTLQPH